MLFTATKAPVPVRVTAPIEGPVEQPVLNRGVPPDDFLEILVRWGAMADAEIFAPNPLFDIYSSVEPQLGPWGEAPPATIPYLHRRAAMLEVLRVLGGFESSWNWSEGGDPDDPQESDPLCQETGIFQVSANSMEFDASLRQCVIDYCGAADPETFIRQMKLKWCFAVEYCARLLRYSIDWDGPISRREIHPWLSRDAMAEFERLLAAEASVQQSGG